MNIKPLGKRVMIKIREKVAQPGKLILNDNPNEPIYADVLDIGDEVTKIKPGQIAYMFPFGGQQLGDGKKMVFEEDIIGVVVE
jgi:co-chaperonin GroES (HSP10)